MWGKVRGHLGEEIHGQMDTGAVKAFCVLTAMIHTDNDRCLKRNAIQGFCFISCASMGLVTSLWQHNPEQTSLVFISYDCTC